MVKIEGTLEELRDLFLQGMLSEAKDKAKKTGRKVVRKTEKLVLTAWQKFLKSFKFRKQRKSEKSTAYFSARTKAASRAYKRMKKGRK